MINIWPAKRIEDISEKVGMGPFGSSIKVETFVSEGVPIISGQHLHGFKLDDSVGYNYITAQHAEKLKGAIVHRGDIVFTHAGNIGQVAVITKDSQHENYVLSQRQFFLRCDPEKSDPEYIVAYFKSPEGRHKLLANTSQVGVPSISKPVTYLRSIEIPLPPLSEQRAIAHILGTLDDKIENNRKTAKTLEAMAQAIFQSWFVDFDPVRAKMAGESRESICQRLKLTPEILDLFPDRLVDSELGEIPEGWMNGSFRNICSRRSERVGSRDATVLSAVTKGHLAKSDDYFTKRVYSNEIKNYLAVERNDFAYNPSRINIGSIGMLESYFLGAVSPVYIVFRPAESYQHFMNFYLGLATTKKWIATFSSGSVRQSLSYDYFADIPCIIPPKETIDLFNAIHDIVKHSYDFSIGYAMKLAGLRDTLLPKLISGEIRVPEAEHLIKEAAG